MTRREVKSEDLEIFVFKKVEGSVSLYSWAFVCPDGQFETGISSEPNINGRYMGTMIEAGNDYFEEGWKKLKNIENRVPKILGYGYTTLKSKELEEVVKVLSGRV